MKSINPPQNCSLCDRLSKFRSSNVAKHSDWFNKPVPSFGDNNCQLLIVGLAPGLKGANKTGRPFTGDYAGDILFPTLIKFGWASGHYNKKADDGLILKKCRITNAVRCVPPQNKPSTQEQKQCRKFLVKEINTLKSLKTILALGQIAHNSIISSFNLKHKNFKFQHSYIHKIDNNIMLIDSYHCSRYNINTRRLSIEMFEEVFHNIKAT